MANNINIKGKKIVSQSQQKSVRGMIQELFCEQIQETGDQNTFCNALAYDCANSEKEENEKREEKETKESTLEGNKKEAQTGGSKKVEIKEGLNYLPVISRWRKNTPNNDDNADELDKMAIINRLKYSDRITVLGKLLEVYDEEQIDKKFEAKDWSVLLKQFNIHSQQAANSNISQLKASQTAIDSAEDIKALEKIISKNSLDMGSVDISKCNLENAKLFVKLTIEDRIFELTNDISTLKEKKDESNYITSWIEKCLCLKNADNLQSGYLYIFLKTPLEEDEQGNKPYTKLKLFSEYKVISSSSEYYFTKFDISNYENIDDRKPLDLTATSIDIPVCYLDKNKQAQEIDVRVLFSHNQLSGPRLKKICDNEDKLSHLKTLDSNKLKKTFEDYHNDSLKQEGNDNVNGTNGPLITQKEWDKVDIYPLYSQSTGLKLNLLVDDPFGMLLENNDYISHLNSLIKEQIDAIHNNVELKSAILGYRIFYNPRTLGICEMDALYHDSSYRIERLKDSDIYRASKEGGWAEQGKRKTSIIENGQKHLSEEKFKKALKHYYRSFIKILIEKAQENGVNYLESSQMKLRWQDHFSRGLVDYQSAHGESLALFAPLCSDPNEIDAVLEPDLLPLDIISGFKTTRYSLDGYNVKEKVTIYGPEGNISSEEISDSKIKIDRTEPAGFDWVKKNILNDNSDLHKMFFPTDDADEYDYNDLKKDENAEGKYNRTYIGIGGLGLQELLDQNADTSYKVIVAKRESIKGTGKLKDNFLEKLQKKLEDGDLIIPISNYLDGFMAMLSRYSTKSYNFINEKFLKVTCDRLQIPRSAISFKKSSFEDSVDYKLLKHLHESERGSYSSRLKHNSYISNGKTIDKERFVNELEDKLSQQQTEELALARKVYESEGTQTISVDKSLSGSYRISAVGLIVFSSAMTIMAINDFKENYEKVVNAKGNSVDDILTNTIAVAKLTKSYMELVQTSAKAFKDISESMSKFISPSTVSDIEKHAGASNIKKTSYKSGEISQKNTKVIKELDVEGKIKKMAIVVASLEVFQSIYRLWNSYNYNDKAVKVSNWLDLAADGFYVASAINQAFKKKAVGSIIGAGAKDQAGRRGGVMLAEKTITSIAGRTVLAFIPIVDVFAFIAFAFEIGSWIAVLFKDNLYVSWAKASLFAKD